MIDFFDESVSKDGKINYTNNGVPFKTPQINNMMQYLCVESLHIYGTHLNVGLYKSRVNKNVEFDLSKGNYYLFNEFTSNGTPSLEGGFSKYDINDTDVIINKGTFSLVAIGEPIKDDSGYIGKPHKTIYIMVINGLWLACGYETMTKYLMPILSDIKLYYDPSDGLPSIALTPTPKTVNDLQAINLLRSYMVEVGTGRVGLLDIENDIDVNMRGSLTRISIYKPDLQEFTHLYSSYPFNKHSSRAYYYSGEDNPQQYIIVFFHDKWYIIDGEDVNKVLDNSNDSVYTKSLTGNITKLTQKQINISLALLKTVAANRNMKNYTLDVGNTNNIYITGYAYSDLTDILTRVPIKNVRLVPNIPIPLLVHDSGRTIFYYDGMWYDIENGGLHNNNKMCVYINKATVYRYTDK